MSGILPANLINTATSEVHATDDFDSQITNSQILHRFWKVHAVQSDFVQDAASTRSRNLFWRVWSSPRLTLSITSERLNALWHRFSQHVDLSPIQIDPAFWAKQEKTNSTDAESVDTDTESRTDTHSDSDEARKDATRRASHQPSRSGIPGIDPSEQDGSALPRRHSNASGSTSNTTSESSTRPSLKRLTSGSKSRVPTVTTANKARPKPLLPRRKSSQSKAPANPPKSPRPALKSPRRESFQDEDVPKGHPPPKPNVPVGGGGAKFTLPSASSWEDELPSNSLSAGLGSEEGSASLVDRDFRGRFAENQRHLSSATNVPALARMRKTGSVVRFADEVVDDIRKGKEREQLSPVLDESRDPSRKRDSVGSEAISDGDESEELELPRTKSQLSLLIKDKRKQSGSQDLGPAPLADDHGREARKKEAELLRMGRKAGAPGGLTLSNSADHRYRSPSPGPLF